MQNWSPDLTTSSGPKYQAIASALTRDIETGRLRAGDRLPAQRALAETLAVDLTTVTKAYNEVRRLGLIEGGGRRGSFVKGSSLSPAPEAEVSVVDTGMNLPPEPVGGSLLHLMKEGLSAILSSPNILTKLQYQPSAGALAEQAAGAAFLRQRGLEVTEDLVVVTSGAQNALHGIVASAFKAGDLVCTGPYVYPGFLAVARRHGLELLPIASDAEGILPEALRDACRDRAAKAIYVVPTNDNPTTATMTLKRRREIATVALEADIQIIEDDAYGLLPSAPLPPLASLAPDQSWHIASLSKIISPALRLAHVRAPSARAAWRLAADLHETLVMAPPLNAALFTRWLREGAVERLISEVRDESKARQALAREILGDLEYQSNPEGYHLWLALPEGVSAPHVVNTLRPAGLSVVPSDAFVVGAPEPTLALRISIGGSLSRERLGRALRMLDALVHHTDNRKPALI